VDNEGNRVYASDVTHYDVTGVEEYSTEEYNTAGDVVSRSEGYNLSLVQEDSNPVVQFLKENFASAYRKHGSKITWVYEGDPNSLTNVTKGEQNPGVTRRTSDGKVTVYINSFAFKSNEWAYLVIGHEFVHADHFVSKQWDRWALKYDRVMASAISDFYAYSWQAQTAALLGYGDRGGLTSAVNHAIVIPFETLIEYSNRSKR
jgi:hypothetical protein